MNSVLELTARDNHKFSAYLAQPKEKPKAGLVILQEIFGVNNHIREVTDLFAEKGYLAIAPSLFDRKERNVELSYDEQGVLKGRKLKDLCNEEALKDIEASIRPFLLSIENNSLELWVAVTKLNNINEDEKFQIITDTFNNIDKRIKNWIINEK